MQSSMFFLELLRVFENLCNKAKNVGMVELEDGIKGWDLDNAHVAKSEGVVDDIVERLNISDLTTIGLVGGILTLELELFQWKR